MSVIRETGRVVPPARRPPGPRGMAALRALRDYRRDPIPTLEAVAREYGDLVSLSVPGMRMLMLNHPSFVHQVLVRNHDNYIKTSGSRTTRRFFGDAMQLNNGDSARSMRRMLAPLFHFDRVAAAWGEMVVDETLAMTGQWGSGPRPGLSQELMDLTLHAAVRMFFGTAAGEETTRLGRIYEEAILSLGNFMLPAWVPSARNRRLMHAVAALDDALYARIAGQRRKDGGGTDLLSALVRLEGKEGMKLTDQQIRNELISLMAASCVTLGVALNQTIRLIAEHPEVEAALAAEAQTIGADVHQLVYTGKVLKEALRLCPPAGLFVRDTVADDVMGDCTVRAGTRIFLPSWIIQRDARFHPDPLAFRPERWTAEYERLLPPCAYFPFGNGSRSCIGSMLTEVMLRLMIATVVRQFRLQAVTVTPPGRSTWPEVEAAGGVQVTLHTRGGTRS